MRSLYNYLSIALCLTISSSPAAVPSTKHEQEPLSTPKHLRAIAATVQLPIDHFNASDTRTFANRFWYNDTFYRPGGPVLFYDEGERGIADGVVPPAFYPDHPVTLLAEKFGALVVAWEHRFYGLSTPFPDLNVTSPHEEMERAFAYLDTEQALEDVVVFARSFELPGLEKALQPNATPWIWIGGSYAGQRAVMIRKRNPGTFWASWSSSAPIEVALEFPEYYLEVSRDLPRKCREVIRRAIERVDEVLLRGSGMRRLRLRWEIVRRWDEGRSWREKMQFVGFAPDFVVAEWFMRVVAVDWQAEGMKGGMNATCRRLTLHDDCGADDPDADITAVLDAIASSENSSGRPPSSFFNFPMDELAWRYQISTEYPYLQTSKPSSPYNILSSFLDFNSTWHYHHELSFPCITSPPNVSALIPTRYAGWDVGLAKRVMITSGLRDPWHQLSALPKDSLVPGAPVNRSARAAVPGCHEDLAENEVFGLVLERGRHCADLVIGNPEAKQATALFAQALEVWLPCFVNDTSR